MKQIKEYISENQSGSQFKGQVKYSKDNWDQWMKMWKDKKFDKDILVGKLDNEPDLELVYKINNTERTVDHIATYNTKKEILYTNDINLFGNEV